MAANSSAGVYVREIDDSQVVEQAGTSIGAVIGASVRGPVGVRKLITSKKRFLEVFGFPDASKGFMHYAALAFLNEASQLYVTRVAPGALFGGARFFVGGSNLNAGASWLSGVAIPENYNFDPSDLFVVYAIDPGVWNQELTVRVYPNTRDNDGTFFVEVYVANMGTAVEQHLVSLDFFTDGLGIQRNIAEYINKRSNYVRVKQNLDQVAYVQDPNQLFINTLTSTAFAGGNNGTAPTTGDFIQAWDLYNNVEEVSVSMLINAGLVNPAIQLKMDTICQRRMDCIAILDVPSLEQDIESAVNFRRTTLNLNSNYSAIYSCDLMILDEYNSVRLFIPPSGHIAAAYAATDRDFATWFAPAGLTRGKLNVLGTRFLYNQGDRDTLVDSEINPIRVIEGVGIAIWGADTMQTKKSALSNVNVRRLMIFLEKSLSAAALYSVFNPNDEILRSRLVEICERFLAPIRKGQGLYSYGVQCDDANNPPEVTAAGDLILTVFVDPVLPAKRILLTAVINRTGARFTAS